ncbi:LytR/AlgR family response regulator transcription factor [Parapedobacter koreensis]|uniref:Two component transcriptional regulator, LytTR family n=1 Tax=Parapedobacter koreensis TaxID=332977 RepID=A0A1H7GPZ4_9SPHI|nr:response regulator transcription factor [Parapedobacter koreensis]SEK40226.1 two component transcriptional regulator, LytTR family [Parapedobacter koreensis]
MQTVRCILVDDEFPALGYLQTLCRQLPYVEVIKSYNNPLKFLNERHSLDFDVCILDITMPGISGVQLARQLRDKAIIFSTAYKEYAAEAFDLDVVDYIRKPYQLGRLEKAFLKAKDWLSAKQLQSNTYLELNTNRGKARINSNEIAFVTVAENDRRDKSILLKDGRYVLAKNITFDHLAHALPARAFCRINRKTLVALDTISSYTGQWVYCISPLSEAPVQFSISEQYREDFKSKLSS